MITKHGTFLNAATGPRCLLYRLALEAILLLLVDILVRAEPALLHGVLSDVLFIGT